MTNFRPNCRHCTEISVLTEQLAPANPTTSPQCIEGLMSGGMRSPNPSRLRTRLRNIGFPAQRAGLRPAPGYVKLKRGEYENINKAFIPLPAELAAMANASAVSSARIGFGSRKRCESCRTASAGRLPNAHGLMDLRAKPARSGHEMAAKGFSLVAPRRRPSGIRPARQIAGTAGRVRPSLGNRRGLVPIAVRVNRTGSKQS